MWLEVDGSRVFAGDGGQGFDPARPAVVFVHGAGMDHTVWQQQSRYLAHHGRAVLAVDLPGHGRSAGAPLAEIGAIADWLVRLLDAAGVERAALVGHSMGALGVLEAAARHPARVSALALLGVAPKMPVHPDLLQAAATGDRVAVDLILGWGFGRRAHRGGNAVPGLWLMGGGGRLIERAADGALAVDLRACDAYGNGLEAATKVACPTLLLLGAADRMTPVRAAAPLAAALTRCRKRVLPDAGHMMMVEAPRETLAALEEFLDEAI